MSEEKQTNGIGTQVFIGLLLLFCGGSAGFGFSQMNGMNSVLADVGISKTEIVNLRESDSLIRKELNDERARTDGRIFALAGLVEKIVDQNTEVIGLVKLQNELLTREKK
jgi:hypothetical protein